MIRSGAKTKSASYQKRGRKSKRFQSASLLTVVQKTRLPPHAYPPVEILYNHGGPKHCMAQIVEFSPLGLGLCAMPENLLSAHSAKNSLPPLRRKVEIILPNGSSLEGLVCQKRTHESLELCLHSNGVSFTELAKRSAEFVLDLRLPLSELVVARFENTLPSLSGLEKHCGSLELVSLDSLVLNLPILRPGVFLGLVIDLEVCMPSQTHTFAVEVSDIEPNTQKGGVDVLMTFGDGYEPFMQDFLNFYIHHQVCFFKNSLKNRLKQSGFGK